MKPVTWDSGVSWDDPNLRWGDPSYLLEPGDTGYVNTAPATPGGGSAKKKGTKTMNETPENQKVLLALAKKMRAGAASLQDTDDGPGFHSTYPALSALVVRESEGT